MDQDSTATTIDSPSPPPLTRERILVLISIAIVAVMFVGMVGLLWWRDRPAPTALLVLRVPMVLNGVTATIDTSRRDLSPIIMTLHGNEEVRIPLPPGEYSVMIDRPGRKPIHADILLIEYSYFPIVLDEHSATQPAKTK